MQAGTNTAKNELDVTRPAADKLPRPVRVAFWLLLIWSVVVVVQWSIVTKTGLASPELGYNIFYYLFANYELVGWLVFVFALVLSLAASTLGARGESDTGLGVQVTSSHYRFGLVGLLGLLGLLWCGTLFIHHGYPFSMDEYNSLFQARIFASGHLKAAIPELFRPYASALTPVFVTHDPAAATWSGSYLPVYSALRALCLDVGLTDLLNPILAVLSVVLVADCARRLWPALPRLPLVAAMLLLTSTQFLAMSISYYSMPAHLCANLLWLSLYLRDTPRSLALLPWVGGLAIGLHQPIVHPLFVAPFCFEILRRRKLVLALYCLVVYGAFLALWYYWHGLSALETEVIARDLSWFRLPNYHLLFVQTVNLTLSGSWQSAALVLCFLCVPMAFRQFSAPVWGLAAGVLLTWIVYFFYFTNQGHGWGYRYIYGVFGNIVLLATYGFWQIAQELGQARAQHLLVVSSCFALLVQLPLRAFEIEHEIRPFARAHAFLRTLPERLVVVDRSFIWYGQDLIRNDPSFAKPPFLFDGNRRMPLKGVQRLGSVRVVRPIELARFKIPGSAELERSASAR